MAALHFTLTIGAATQSLADLLTQDGQPPMAPATGLARNLPLRWISLQQDASNTHVIYVGGTNQPVTSSVYGFRMEIPVTSIPPAPNIIEGLTPGALTVGDIWILGTSGEKLHVQIVPYL